jgi:hypothetical protein
VLEQKKKKKSSVKFFFLTLLEHISNNKMASLQSLKAPTLMSKKTQKQVRADEDDVIIDATALPSRAVEEADVTMEEGSTTDKPNFAPASAAELKVNQEPDCLGSMKTRNVY